MQYKSAEFRERGGEVYLPADTVVAAATDSVDAERRRTRRSRSRRIDDLPAP